MEVAHSNNVIRQILRKDEHVAAAERSDRLTEETAEYEAFNFGRVGARPQLMVVFTHASGSRYAAPYAQLLSIQANELLTQLILDFSHVVVTIAGQNLWPLFSRLCHHRVTEIVEMSSADALSCAAEACTVTSLRLKVQPRSAHQMT